MPIVIGPKTSLLSQLGLGLSEYAGGYGQGYGQHASGIQSGLQQQGQAWTGPIQSAVKEQAGFFTDLAYQHQAQQFKMQLQNQVHQQALDTLDHHQMLSANAGSMMVDGIPMFNSDTIAAHGGSSCPGGICGTSRSTRSRSAGAFDLTTIPTVGGNVAQMQQGTQGQTPPDAMGDRADSVDMGPPAPGSMPIQAQPEDTWETRWRSDPHGLASGVGQDQYVIQNRQNRQQQQQVVAQTKAGNEWRVAGDTPDAFQLNQAKYQKATLEARDVMNDPTLQPPERQMAAQRIMSDVQGIAPGWNKKLQPTMQEQVQSDTVPSQNGDGYWSRGAKGLQFHRGAPPGKGEQQGPPDPMTALLPNEQLNPTTGTVIRAEQPPAEAGGGPPNIYDTGKHPQDLYFERKQQLQSPPGTMMWQETDPKTGKVTTHINTELAREQAGLQKTQMVESAKTIQASEVEKTKEQQADAKAWDIAYRSAATKNETGATTINHELAQKIHDNIVGGQSGIAPGSSANQKLEAVKQRARQGDALAQGTLRKYGVTW